MHYNGDYEQRYNDNGDGAYQGKLACHTLALERTRKCQRSQARLLSTFNFIIGMELVEIGWEVEKGDDHRELLAS